jgi:cell division protein FtsW
MPIFNLVKDNSNSILTTRVGSKAGVRMGNRLWGYDWYLIFLIFAICIYGFTFLASALAPQPTVYFRDLTKQILVGGLLGGAGAFALARFDYHNVIKYRWVLLWFTYISLGFLAVFGIAVSTFKVEWSAIESLTKFLPFQPKLVNGAVRWIKFPIGLPDFQPSEIAKVVLLIFVAGEIGRISKKPLELKEKVISNWQSLKNTFGLVAGVCGLILFQPDLGTVIMIMVILASSFWVANISPKIITGMAIVAMVVGLFAVATQSYRWQRILSSTDASQVSDQVSNNKEAVIEGGLWGKGYGNSYGKNDYSTYQIYEGSTDSIIAIIAEEVGFVGVMFLLLLFFLIFLHIMKIASNAPDIEGKILAVGIVTWVIFQVFMNTAGMTGLIPMKGLPLPFVSEGGTSLLILLLSMGMVLNISSQRVRA